MNKAVFCKISIIGIILLIASSFALCPYAMAQWGWGPPFTQGGWGFGSSNGWGFGLSNGWGFGSSSGPGGYFANDFFAVPPPFDTVAPISIEIWDGWNDNGWEEFITAIQEEYPDLEGIDWDTWKQWDDDDWEAFQTALEDVRTQESLDSFISDVTEKWDEYDNDEWEKFNTNWNNFIADAEADTENDTELTWAGFLSTYGHSDSLACFKAYETWINTQWSDFCDIYHEYLDYECDEFNEALQARLDDYYDVDWEDWREWTDDEWESYLNRYSSFRTSGYTGYSYRTPSSVFSLISPGGFGYSSPVEFSYGTSRGFYGYGPGGYGLINPNGFGYGSPVEFGYGTSSGFYGYDQGGFGYGAASGGYYYGGPSWGGNWW